MDYKCSVCKDTVSGDLKAFIDHTDNHVIDLVKEKHPEWIQNDGMCQKCFDYYRGQIEGKSV